MVGFSGSASTPGMQTLFLRLGKHLGKEGRKILEPAVQGTRY